MSCLYSTYVFFSKRPIIDRYMLYIHPKVVLTTVVLILYTSRMMLLSLLVHFIRTCRTLTIQKKIILHRTCTGTVKYVQCTQYRVDLWVDIKSNTLTLSLFFYSSGHLLALPLKIFSTPLFTEVFWWYFSTACRPGRR